MAYNSHKYLKGACLFYVLCIIQINTIKTVLAAESISISEVTQLDFAQLEIPVSGSETIIINPTTGGITGSGTVQIGSPTRGEYKIVLSGSGSTTSCTIDIQNINSGSAQVTIDQFTGDFDGVFINSFPRSGLSKPAVAPGSTLYLGATAQYTNGTPVGNLIPSFDIVVTLQ